MKCLARYAGKGEAGTQKYDVHNFEAKYWGTYGQKGNKFVRSDGSVGTDKTKGFHSRTGKKASLRQANRAITKRGRQMLKRQMLKELDA